MVECGVATTKFEVTKVPKVKKATTTLAHFKLPAQPVLGGFKTLRSLRLSVRTVFFTTLVTLNFRLL